MKLSMKTKQLAGFTEMHAVTLTNGPLTVRLPVLRTPEESARLRRVWEARGFTVCAEVELVEPEVAA